MTGKFTGAANGLNKLFIPDLATVKDQATQNVLRKLITWANNLGSNNPSVGQVLTTVANPSKSPYGLSGPTAKWQNASGGSVPVANCQISTLNNTATYRQNLLQSIPLNPTGHAYAIFSATVLAQRAFAGSSITFWNAPSAASASAHGVAYAFTLGTPTTIYTIKFTYASVAKSGSTIIWTRTNVTTTGGSVHLHIVTATAVNHFALDATTMTHPFIAFYLYMQVAYT